MRPARLSSSNRVEKVCVCVCVCDANSFRFSTCIIRILRIRLLVLLQLLVQRVAVDAEAVGGFDLHALAEAEHMLDEFALEAADALADFPV